MSWRWNGALGRRRWPAASVPRELPDETVSVEPATTWPVLLAGGDGTRLRELTRLPSGEPVPKQFCALEGPTSLLRLALARVRPLAPPERTLAVLADSHRRWWQPQLAELPPENRLVQPSNRGTAPAVLLAARAAAARTRRAVLLLVPTDHYVVEEERLGEAIARAVAHAHADPRRVVLVGVEAEAAEPGFGWILPAGDGDVRRVERFVEKPDEATARELRARGALVNTFLLAASASLLLELFARHLPELAAAISRFDADEERLAATYSRLSSVDLSRHLLERVAENLWVVPASRCGWNDLGTPERVAGCLGRKRRVRRRPWSQPRAGAPLELARVLHDSASA